MLYAPASDSKISPTNATHSFSLQNVQILSVLFYNNNVFVVWFWSTININMRFVLYTDNWA